MATVRVIAECDECDPDPEDERVVATREIQIRPEAGVSVVAYTWHRPWCRAVRRAER